MRLPYADRAVIEKTKIRDYLLSSAHPVGRFKAVFFTALGYLSEDWRRLESDLREMVLSQDAKVGQKSKYGQKYEVYGTLRGPSGKTANVVTVWIILDGEEVARFVTAFPGDKV